MIALYIIAGIIAFFAIILSLNVSFRIIFYSSAKEDMRLYAKIGFYKINIMPAKPAKEKKAKKTKKIRKPKKTKEKPGKAVKEKKEKPKGKKKLDIPAIFDFVKDIGTVLLRRFKKHLKVKIYKINVILASDEAEKTAMLYGAASQSACYLFEFLDYHNFKVYKNPGKIKIIPDFSKSKIEFDVNIKFYMRLSHIAALGIVSLFKFLGFWGKMKKEPT